MFSKYYQDELAFLRELGQEFARAHPQVAHLLAEPGSDPDVERLLEGFAFLTARIRQKLDDELPELTHALLSLLWPHYLRPIPSMSILEFEPLPQALRERQRIVRGTEVDSVPVEGTSCRFRTCYDVDLYPLSLVEAALEAPPGARHRLRLRFQLWKGVQLAQSPLSSLRLHLHGDPVVSYLIYLWLCRHVHGIRIQAIQDERPGRSLTLRPQVIKPVGFAEEEALLPYPLNSFVGFRLLQEYFALPAKFLFVDVTELERLSELNVEDTFEIIFEFSRALPSAPRIGKENIRLNCTPIINLFARDADPIRVEHDKVEYRIRPAGPDPFHYEVYSVDRVFGWVEGMSKQKAYRPFFSFAHSLSASDDGNEYYQTRICESVIDAGTDTYISFVSGDQTTIVPSTEVISLELTCTNRHLPEQLRVGDIKVPTSSSPEFVQFRNIANVTPAIRPPLGGDLHWRLISHLALNYLSLASREALRGILELYNFQALYDRQAARENELRLEGIRSVRARPADMLFRGTPIRGTAIEIELQEENFAGEGDIYLFASILNEFFGLYATLNSFTQLTIRGSQYGEVYSWPPRIGRQIIL